MVKKKKQSHSISTVASNQGKKTVASRLPPSPDILPNDFYKKIPAYNQFIHHLRPNSTCAYYFFCSLPVAGALMLSILENEGMDKFEQVLANQNKKAKEVFNTFLNEVPTPNEDKFVQALKAQILPLTLSYIANFSDEKATNILKTELLNNLGTLCFELAESVDANPQEVEHNVLAYENLEYKKAEYKNSVYLYRQALADAEKLPFSESQSLLAYIKLNLVAVLVKGLPFFYKSNDDTREINLLINGLKKNPCLEENAFNHFFIHYLEACVEYYHFKETLLSPSVAIILPAPKLQRKLLKLKHLITKVLVMAYQEAVVTASRVNQYTLDKFIAINQSLHLIIVELANRFANFTHENMHFDFQQKIFMLYEAKYLLLAAADSANFACDLTMNSLPEEIRFAEYTQPPSEHLSYIKQAIADLLTHRLDYIAQYQVKLMNEINDLYAQQQFELAAAEHSFQQLLIEENAVTYKNRQAKKFTQASPENADVTRHQQEDLNSPNEAAIERFSPGWTAYHNGQQAISLNQNDKAFDFFQHASKLAEQENDDLLKMAAENGLADSYIAKANKTCREIQLGQRFFKRKPITKQDSEKLALAIKDYTLAKNICLRMIKDLPEAQLATTQKNYSLTDLKLAFELTHSTIHQALEKIDTEYWLYLANMAALKKWLVQTDCWKKNIKPKKIMGPILIDCKQQHMLVKKIKAELVELNNKMAQNQQLSHANENEALINFQGAFFAAPETETNITFAQSTSPKNSKRLSLKI